MPPQWYELQNSTDDPCGDESPIVMYGGSSMSGKVMYAVGLFLAVVTIAAIGSDNRAEARLGCGGSCAGASCGGDCGGWDCCGRKHRKRCGGLFSRRCKGRSCHADSCGGSSCDCGGSCRGGLFARMRARRCCAPSCCAPATCCEPVSCCGTGEAVDGGEVPAAPEPAAADAAQSRPLVYQRVSFRR